MTKNIKESEDTKIKILSAAKKEFAEKGFNGARMSSIASTAKVNQALLHYHFKDKQNLYRSIFQTKFVVVIDEFTKRLSVELENLSDRVELQLCAAIYTIISISTDSHDDDLHKIFARELAEEKGLLHEYVKKYMMPRIYLFEEIIHKGVEKGIFEISNTLMFTLNIIYFIADFSHGEMFFKGSPDFESLFKNKKEKLYKYMIETVFKTLKPEGKDIEVPELQQKTRKKIDQIINAINKEYMF